MFYFFMILLYIPIVLLWPTRVISKHNIPKKKEKKGFIVCANHLSNFDVVLLDIKFARKINFLAKKELFKSKFSSKFYTSFGAISVDRQNIDMVSYKKAITVLKDNKPLGIFPEGTRNKTNDLLNMQDVKSGAIVFASKTGTPIIPVAIFRKPKLFRCNAMIVGEPFYPVGENPQKLTKEEVEQNTQKLVEIIDTLHGQLVDTFGKKNVRK